MGCQLNLEDLGELAEWMRKHGARRARCGEVELELGPEPQTVTEAPPPPSDDEVVEMMKHHRKQQEALLFASSEGFPDFDE